MRDRPFAPYGAAGVQVIETAGVFIASVLSAIDTAAGKSYEFGSGVALTVIGFCTVAALAVVAVGLAWTRWWSWMPAMLTQLFVLIVGVYLLQSHRYDWGGPAVALSIAAAVALLLPRSLAAYGRRIADPPEDSQSGSRPPDRPRTQSSSPRAK